jgi:predicted Holliday junction resolvase-like endonuclease
MFQLSILVTLLLITLIVSLTYIRKLRKKIDILERWQKRTWESSKIDKGDKQC